jgi:hypothetical protein
VIVEIAQHTPRPSSNAMVSAMPSTIGSVASARCRSARPRPRSSAAASRETCALVSDPSA